MPHERRRGRNSRLKGGSSDYAGAAYILRFKNLGKIWMHNGRGHRMLENTGRATVKAVPAAVRPFHPEISVVEHKRGKGRGKIDRWQARLSFTLAVAEGGGKSEWWDKQCEIQHHQSSSPSTQLGSSSTKTAYSEVGRLWEDIFGVVHSISIFSRRPPTSMEAISRSPCRSPRVQTAALQCGSCVRPGVPLKTVLAGERASCMESRSTCMEDSLSGLYVDRAAAVEAVSTSSEEQIRPGVN